jgi:hypothetical protein
LPPKKVTRFEACAHLSLRSLNGWLAASLPQFYNRAMQPGIKPATILRHAYGIYPSLAMLAGMQLDLFTPLKDGL